MDILPLELLHEIASHDVGAYRAFLGVPLFSRSLNPTKITDYMISFGHSVKITVDSIGWYRHGKYYREDGPAIELANGNKYWYYDGKYHRNGGPAVQRADGYEEWY